MTILSDYTPVLHLYIELRTGERMRLTHEYYRPTINAMKPYDLLALACSLAAIGGSILVVGQDDRGEVSAYIRTAEERFIYPLTQARSFAVGGPLGDTHIQIADGGISVVSSPCRDKICIIGGRISQTRQWLACLPNRVLISRARWHGGG